MADPLFVRPATNRRDSDFTLLAGSPAVDSAGPELTPKTDLVGTARPQGAGADRGAFEWKAP